MRVSDHRKVRTAHRQKGRWTYRNTAGQLEPGIEGLSE